MKKNVIRVVVAVALIGAGIYVYLNMGTDTLNNQGVKLIRQEKYKEAIEVLEQALAEDPENVSIRKNLAEAYERDYQLLKASEVYPSEIGLNPKYFGKQPGQVEQE